MTDQHKPENEHAKSADNSEALNIPPQEESQPEEGAILNEGEIYDRREEQLSQLQAEVAKLKDSFIRARAENDNLHKRHERDLQNAYKFAAEKVVADLLPVLDSLSLGLDAAKNQSENNEALSQFIAGLEMTLKLLSETLTKHGVTEIDPQGEKFNPDLHNALTMTPSGDVAPNTILQVAQKGYVLNGRVIRAAQVIVSRAP